MKKAALAFAAILALASTQSHANDSSSAIGLGGLELRQNEAISMDSEDLFLSMEKVTVKYRFTNHSTEDIETLVSFPLPTIPDEIRGHMGDVGYPDWKELEFHTLVDGVEAQLDYSEVATANDRNVTARLKELGWPLKYWKDYKLRDHINKLPEEAKVRYFAEGLLRKAELDKIYYGPAWQIATYVNRTQKFPAGKTITVEHSYKPITGGSIGGMMGEVAGGSKEEYAKDYAAAYCMDKAFIAGFKNTTATKERQAKKTGSEMGGFYVEFWLDYVLKSGANWRGPIKDFRMVIDKGHPDNLISLCADGVKKISPTQFEVVKKNFEPIKDIEILIVHWPDSE